MLLQVPRPSAATPRRGTADAAADDDDEDAALWRQTRARPSPAAKPEASTQHSEAQPPARPRARLTASLARTRTAQSEAGKQAVEDEDDEDILQPRTRQLAAMKPGRPAPTAAGVLAISTHACGTQAEAPA